MSIRAFLRNWLFGDLQRVQETPLRSLLISQIRASKRWGGWEQADPDLDGYPPVLENLSDADLLEHYDFYVCNC